MRNDETLPSELEQAIGEMRQFPEPRADWLANVARLAAQEEIERHRNDRERRWSMRPATAIAAGLACALLGAGTMFVVTAQRMRGAEFDTATVPIEQAGMSPVRFTFAAPGAASVHIVGDFNAWNPTVAPMRPVGNGQVWEVVIPLRPGRYTYAFVVDGRLARDPSAAQVADDDFGVPSSVLLVKGDT